MKLHDLFTKQLIITVTILLTTLTIFSQTKIPSTWQPGMKLTMSYGGGMRYYSYKLEIKDTGSYMIVNDEGRISNYKLDITGKDLDSLLFFLEKNHFNSIRSEMTGPVNDKGTENIFLSWGNNFIGVGESHMQDIVAKDKDYYSAIYHYIYSLGERTKRKVKELPEETVE